MSLTGDRSCVRRPLTPGCRQVAELMVSSYDPVLGKTIWQCAQCHYSSKLRYTVKEHVETHISGFCHQCPLCAKTCKTR